MAKSKQMIINEQRDEISRLKGLLRTQFTKRINLETTVAQIGRIACGEDHVADNDGMQVIYTITKQALEVSNGKHD